MPNSSSKHFLDIKVPPLVIVLIVAAMMWLVARVAPEGRVLFPGRNGFAICFVLAGIVIISLGMAAIRRAGTTVNPMKPESASALVNTGIYKRTRNPMYLGLLLVLLAWAIFLSNGLTFLFLPLFIVYMNRFQIEPEERALASNFGEEFVAYKAKVRRWI